MLSSASFSLISLSTVGIESCLAVLAEVAQTKLTLSNYSQYSICGGLNVVNIYGELLEKYIALPLG